MLCPGCGKRIPFVGDVCPYCQRPKGRAQGLYLLTLAGTGVAAFVGYALWRWPGLFGAAAAAWVLGHAWASYRASAPPETRPRP